MKAFPHSSTRVSIVLAGLLLLCSDTAHSQVWRKLGTLPATQSLRFHCAFFWDTAHGVVGGRGYTYRYNSGVWTQGTYPETPIAVASIRELRPGILYVAPIATQLWISTDSGSSWQFTGVPALNAEEVFMKKGGSLGWITEGSFVRLDSNICVEVFDDDSLPSYSWDGGITWHKSTGNGIQGGFGLYADTCRKLFTTVTEGGGLFNSFDSGKTWVPIQSQGWNPPDVMNGADGVMYWEQVNGLQCSVDGGYTWQSLGGPGGSGIDDDSRLFAFGPNGSDVIMFYGDEVWLCVDTTTIFPTPPSPIRVHDTILDCTGARLPIRIQPPNPIRRTYHIHVTDLPPQPSITFDTIIVCSHGLPVTWWITLPALDSSKAVRLKIETSGGDECLLSSSWVDYLNIGRMLSPPTVVMPNNLALQPCTGSRIPVLVRGSKCEPVRLDSIVFDSSLPVFPRVFILHDTIPQNGTDTIWTTVLPGSSPSSGIIRCSIYELEQRQEFDTETVLRISMDGTIPGAVLSAAASAQLSNCGVSALPIVLHGIGCDSVSFSEFTITIGNSIKYSVGRLFPETLQHGTSDTVWISFPVQGLNTSQLMDVHVKGSYGGGWENFDTTLHVLIKFVSNSGSLIPEVATVSMDSILTCTSRDTLIVFQNLGCDTIRVTRDNTTWLPGWSANDPQFPFALSPDSSFGVDVHFSSTTTGSSTQYVSFEFDALGQSGLLSLEVRLDATTIVGKTILSLDARLRDAGNIPYCAGDTTLIIPLASLGCDTLFLKRVSVDGDSAFSLLTSTPLFLMKDSLNLRIRFAPRLKGQHSATCSIVTQDSSYQIPLSGIGLPGIKYLTTSLAAVDFGSLRTCESLDTILSLHNPGCDTLIVDSIMTLSRSWIIAAQQYPFRLGPSDSAVVALHLAPDTNGKPPGVSGTLIVYCANSDSGKSIRIPLQATVRYAEPLTLTLTNPPNATAGHQMPVFVLLTGRPAGDTSIRSIQFVVTTNDDLMTLQDTSIFGLHLDSIRYSHDSTSGLNLATQYYTTSPVPTGDTLGRLFYTISLTGAESSPAMISNVAFDNKLGLPNDCVASLSASSTLFNYINNNCTDTLMRGLLETGSIHVESVRPNPAKDQIEIVLGGIQQTGPTVLCEMYDVLGRTILSGAGQSAGQGAERVALDVSGIPEGIYFLRIIAGNVRETRQIAIQR